MLSIIDHLQSDGFTVYTVENHKGIIQYQGRDGYRKVALISGVGQINYDHNIYKINGSVLLVANAGVRCTWSLSSAHHTSYVCAFTEDFLHDSCLGSNKECDQYFVSNPVFSLNSDQEKFVGAIFGRMIEEKKTDYAFKSELMQNQICVLTHMAFRMVPSTKSLSSSSNPSSIAAVYLELIEVGFPPVGQLLYFN